MAGWALAVSIASLVVAIGAVVSTWYLWRRSGPEIVVIIHDYLGDPRLPWKCSVEVVNSGRMPVVIREVGVKFHEGHATSTGGYTAYTDHKLDADEPYPITIAPTGYLLVEWPVASPSPGALRTSSGRRTWGYAVRGDGQRFESKDYVLP